MGSTIIKTFALAALASTALAGMTLPNAASAQDRHGQNTGYSHSQTYDQGGGRSNQGYRAVTPAYDQRSYGSGHDDMRGRDNRGYRREDRGRNDWGHNARDRRETQWSYGHHHHHHQWRENDRRGW